MHTATRPTGTGVPAPACSSSTIVVPALPTPAAYGRHTLPIPRLPLPGIGKLRSTTLISKQVHDEIGRLSEAGLFTEEQIATTCCFATQDKVWVTAPDAERWEVYTVLADSETFGTAPELTDVEAVQVCCGTPEEAAAEGRAAADPPRGRRVHRMLVCL
ncbi:hypothetical protein [Nocardia sp. NPDC051570]|uniref:hypothetical protein n=1 Tax=Nocardia sp. NPDC051570 TaxID=3364324 RepID=UPI0037B5B1F4